MRLHAAFVALLSASSATAAAIAASDCASAKADGFASLNGGTTGGAGGKVVTVSNQADLEKYVATDGKHVIKVKGKITINPLGHEMRVKSDKTIVGIGNDAEIEHGGFDIFNQHNVIVRNLRIGKSKEEKENDNDAIQIDNSTNIWIDHCHLESAGDGLIDSRKDTSFITVSWTILRNDNKAFGIGWTPNVTARVTVHHNWFDHNIQRNPSCDNARYAHLYNNYMTGITSYGHLARGHTEMRMENCYFKDTKNPVKMDPTAKLNATGNIYVNVSGTTAKNKGSVFEPSSFYSYHLDSADDVPSLVSSGAGRQSSICPS